jgi:hypothetical protein
VRASTGDLRVGDRSYEQQHGPPAAHPTQQWLRPASVTGSQATVLSQIAHKTAARRTLMGMVLLLVGVADCRLATHRSRRV